MADYHPRNERIKKEYFRVLTEADQLGRATVDGIRKAILRYEQFTGFADFAEFDRDKAIGFKRHLAKLKAERTGKPLSQATVLSTLHAVQEFFRWLGRELGYKSKIRMTDVRYFNLSRNDVAAARSPGSKKAPTLEQIGAAIAAMPQETDVERRDRALLAFIIVTGMRDSAVASLRLKHVDIDEKLVVQDPREVATKFAKRIDTFFFPVGEPFEGIVIDWVRHLRELLLFSGDDPVFPRTKVAPNAESVFAVQGLEPVFWQSAAPIRGTFKEAFAAAGLAYFTPHSFRTTLVILGERICKTPEQFKAWSQNLGHESPLTTFTSYGRVELHRQGALIRGAGKADPVDDRIERIMRAVERIEKRRSPPDQQSGLGA
jgi:integrase